MEESQGGYTFIDSDSDLGLYDSILYYYPFLKEPTESLDPLT